MMSTEVFNSLVSYMNIIILGIEPKAADRFQAEVTEALQAQTRELVTMNESPATSPSELATVCQLFASHVEESANLLRRWADWIEERS